MVNATGRAYEKQQLGRPQTLIARKAAVRKLEDKAKRKSRTKTTNKKKKRTATRKPANKR